MTTATKQTCLKCGHGVHTLSCIYGCICVCYPFPCGSYVPKEEREPSAEKLANIQKKLDQQYMAKLEEENACLTRDLKEALQILSEVSCDSPPSNHRNKAAAFVVKAAIRFWKF